MKISLADIRQIRNQVQDRVSDEARELMLAVGVGIKNYSRRKAKRELAILITVKHKLPRNQLRVGDRFGKGRRIDVFLKKRGQRVRLRLPTDVIDVSRRKIVPVAATGTQLDGNGDVVASARRCCSGLLVSWDDNSGKHWGLVTVGHGLIDTTTDYDFFTQAWNARVVQRPRWISDPAMEFDIGVIEIDHAQAAMVAGVAYPESLPPVEPAKLENIETDIQVVRDNGRVVKNGSNVHFDLIAIHDQFKNQVQGFPSLGIVVEAAAIGGGEKPFDYGTSGAPWMLDPHSAPFAMHIASRTDRFDVGYAQPLSHSLQFLKNKLGAKSLNLVLAF